jgi:branched-chain amino acid aminotransferase
MTAAAVRELLWFDGALVEPHAVAIAPLTHALHYGSGAFEGIRAYETARGPGVFRLRDHLRRLYASADVYGLRIAYSLDQLARAIFHTLRANDLESGYVRPLAYFGEGGIALSPRNVCPTHLLVAALPLSGSLLGDRASVQATISPWRKTPSRSLPSTAKVCGHYTNSILAKHDAHSRGFDEAILLNDRGDVAEGTGENVFLVRSGRLYTNDASADVLEGITQATVVELARDLGIAVEIGRVTVGELRAADEVFLTGTAAEVMPVSRIDDRPLPEAHPIADALQAAYANAVRGLDPSHPDWVEYDASR